DMPETFAHWTSPLKEAFWSAGAGTAQQRYGDLASGRLMSRWKATKAVSGECWHTIVEQSSLVWNPKFRGPEFWLTLEIACADKMIRVFDVTGKLKQTIGGSQDVVRALCKLPSGHPSGAHFASAGNDAVIRLWTLQGQLVAEHHGHQSFIYSLAVLPSGELVSSGEDRTVRVWAGANCIQTITHPAISVWSVAACKETGDIVSGASDRTVRVFSRTPERHADEAVSQRFEKSVQESAIPQQQVGNINKDNLPGPEFLQQKLGTKDGQVQMIREANGSVSAYTWSSATNEWVNVGTVVDSVGSSGRKTEYMGQDYDYVFDVDIEDGAPPLKLPYNLSQNPYQVAQKFIADNELPISYIDQVTQFIINNTQGQSLDQTAGASAAPQTTTAPAPPRPKVLPQKTYLSIKTANLQVIYKKIQEINSKLESEGNKEATLNPSEIDVLGGLVEELGKPEPLEKSEGLKLGIQLAAKIATAWPVANRIPGLDLLRLLASASPLTATADYSGADLIPFLLGSGAFDEPVKPNHAMLIVRTFANLFESEEGRNLVSKYQDSLFTCISGLMDKSEASSNRNLVIAATTLLINMSVWITSGDKTSDPSASDHALQMLDILSRIPFIGKDSEAVYRALVAFGTLVVVCGGEVKQAAKDVFDIDSVLSKILADDIGREPRIQGVTSEIREALR
ncbi:hypothetical protein KEM55_001892, partial [Ascosphaera atra]